jgi:hypothetical protein
MIGCAKVGSPTGGPKDINPPQNTGCTPENRSTNFTGEKIDIEFNEYVQLKNQNKEILISPPLKDRPAIRVREKSIRIILNNDLLPQTTYTINFGNSLSDLNESNGLPDFEYVFSTGNTIDSLSVTGKIANAFDHKPDKDGGLMIMLYENLSDSAPLVELPKYYGRANKDGLFAVNNIQADTFRIVAIKDANNNMKYDVAAEEIAFLDSSLIINAGNVISQTYIKDTIKIIIPAGKPGKGNKQGKELAEADTIIAPGKLLNARNISLYYFMEEPKRVFITGRNRESPEKLSFVFSRPLYDTLKLMPLNFRPAGEWFVKEASRNNDTITYWISDTLVSKLDTLKFKLTYLSTDSTDHLVERNDTVTLRFTFPGDKAEKSLGGRRSKSNLVLVKRKPLEITSSLLNRGIQNLNRPIFFVAEKPLQVINADSIEFYKLVDTVYMKQPFTCSRETSSVRRFSFISTWEGETQFRLLLKPGTVTDIYGTTNDSLALNFTTQSSDYYGLIRLSLEGEEFPLLVQVLNEKGSVVAAKSVTAPGLILFDFLPPGNYNLKAVYDKNGNGKWDTGSFLKHLQPEKIFLSGSTVQLRSGWDLEVSWKISE